ncbi:unnamed protein product [Nezara viridula]|uniref:Uncharacterized protein n=1 Tax=Nezara viridula TaxID=85310 RepID=A0A9P0E4F4_NEZVI|nr:unnamed protein product [Nezara viridula]
MVPLASLSHPREDAEDRCYDDHSTGQGMMDHGELTGALLRPPPVAVKPRKRRDTFIVPISRPGYSSRKEKS